MTRLLVNSEWQRFVAFLVVGAINTGFGFGAFALFFRIGLGRDFAVVLATIVGVIFNFRTIGSVFTAHGLARMPHFVAAYSMLLVANLALLRSVLAIGIGPYLGEALVVLVIAPLSFLIMRRFVFGSAMEPVS